MYSLVFFSIKFSVCGISPLFPELSSSQDCHLLYRLLSFLQDLYFFTEMLGFGTRSSLGVVAPGFHSLHNCICETTVHNQSVSFCFYPLSLSSWNEWRIQDITVLFNQTVAKFTTSLYPLFLASRSLLLQRSNIQPSTPSLHILSVIFNLLTLTIQAIFFSPRTEDNPILCKISKLKHLLEVTVHHKKCSNGLDKSLLGNAK